MKLKLILIIAVVLVAGIVALYFVNSSKSADISYRTTTVKFGDLTETISATGTVEPEDLIDVGAQVAGRIVSFGRDSGGKAIDYGSKVDEGTVLARIDDVLYEADVLEARAKLEDTKAYLMKAQADIGQLLAMRELAQNNFTRATRLQTTNSNSKADYDQCKAELDSSEANLEVGKALVKQAQASIQVAEAALKRAERNLDYCTIRSPVKGIVIDRRVNIGQTVVSSLNAPSLFLIAKDLTKMEVWVSVNEADIGKIKVGQNVTFTVDAFPDDKFQGKVAMIRMNASVTQNVVTYIVEVATDNSDGKLLPYLTANVNFEIETRKNVFMVPNSALRWKPDTEQTIAENGSKTPSKPKIWILEGKKIKPLEVTTGITNGLETEIRGEGLKEGMEIVCGINSGDQKNASTNSPFVPQFKFKK